MCAEKLFFSFVVAPGPVRNLHAERQGAKYVLLKWLPPDEPNGVLLGYDIGYQPGKICTSLKITRKNGVH